MSPSGLCVRVQDGGACHNTGWTGWTGRLRQRKMMETTRVNVKDPREKETTKQLEQEKMR